MLNFDSDSSCAQKLAIHYSKKINDEYVINFMCSKLDITSPEEALKVAKVFWQMTDLAIDDNENNVTIDGVNDLEFWMHKLFNKVSGYLKKQGYEAQWDQATDEQRIYQ